MKTSLMSTVSLWNAPRANLSKLQSDLANATKEMTTGRSVDVGLRLGAKSRDAFAIRQEMGFLQSIADGNANVNIRLDAAYGAMDSIRISVEEFAASLISAPVGSRSIDTVVGIAAITFGTVSDNLNRSVNGQYVLGGANTAVRPVAPYDATSEAKAATDAAFAAFFGFSASDVAVGDITPDQMLAFLEGPFNDLFEPDSWGANWSRASDQPISTRISENAVVDTSVSANDKAFRDIARGFSMLMDLGIGGMSEETGALVLERATRSLQIGASGVADLQTRVGLVQANVTASNDATQTKLNMYTTLLNDMEGVDPLEAKVRIDAITTQMETSFSLTSQLRKLNLINYL